MINKKMIFAGIILLLLTTGIAVAQVGGLSFPPTWTAHLGNVPSQTAQQPILFSTSNGCKYNGNIYLDSISIYDFNSFNGQTNFSMSYSIGNATDKWCVGVTEPTTISLGLSASQGQLINNFNSALTTYVTNQINSNVQPPTLPSPISVGSGG